MLQEEKDQEKVAAFAKSVLEDCGDDAMMVNQLSWAFVQMTEAGRLNNKALLEAAVTVTTAAVEKADAESRAAIQDTLAHLHYLTGNLDKAIEVQKAAIETAGDELKGEMEEFLKKLEAEKAEKK